MSKNSYSPLTKITVDNPGAPLKGGAGVKLPVVRERNCCRRYAFLWILVILLIGGGVGGGTYWYLHKKSQDNHPAAATNTSTPGGSSSNSSSATSTTTPLLPLSGTTPVTLQGTGTTNGTNTTNPDTVGALPPTNGTNTTIPATNTVDPTADPHTPHVDLTVPSSTSTTQPWASNTQGLPAAAAPQPTTGPVHTDLGSTTVPGSMTPTSSTPTSTAPNSFASTVPGSTTPSFSTPTSTAPNSFASTVPGSTTPTSSTPTSTAPGSYAPSMPGSTAASPMTLSERAPDGNVYSWTYTPPGSVDDQGHSVGGGSTVQPSTGATYTATTAPQTSQGSLMVDHHDGNLYNGGSYSYDWVPSQG